MALRTEMDNAAGALSRSHTSSPAGKIISLEVDSSDTIDKLKANIEDKERM